MSPLPLFGARALADWVLAGGVPQRPVSGYRWRSSWQAWWFEHHWRTEEAHLAQLPLPEDPLFITGLWRSGTTVLHELLHAASGWPTALTWQCFSPSTCFLTRPPRSDATVSRPMDAGRISALGAQEDEFALLLLGEPSVYRGFIDPRRLRACGDELWQQREGELRRWQLFVRGIAATAPGQRLLLKSPSHSFRLPLLTRLFPRAQFLWIGRHTGEMLASNLRMWQAMCARYALWECPPQELEAFLRDVLSACVQALGWCLDHLTREQLLWVDFEALRTDPRTTLSAIARFTGQRPGTPANWDAVIDRVLETVPVHPGQRSDTPEDAATYELESVMDAMRDEFGIGTVNSR